VNAQRTHLRQLRATVEALQTVGARISGVALNCLTSDSPSAYYRYYGYEPRSGGGSNAGQGQSDGPVVRPAAGSPPLISPWPLQVESSSSSADHAP